MHSFVWSSGKKSSSGAIRLREGIRLRGASRLRGIRLREVYIYITRLRRTIWLPGIRLRNPSSGIRNSYLRLRNSSSGSNSYNSSSGGNSSSGNSSSEFVFGTYI